MAVRRVASRALINAQLWRYRRARKHRGVRTFLFTATFDDGILPIDTTEIPLYRIERNVRRALHILKLEGICAFDIDVLHQAGEGSRLLLVHVHAVCWTRDPDFKVRAAENVLKKRRAFLNRLSAPSIVIRSRAESASRNQYTPLHPERDQTAESTAWLGHYLLKPTTCLKKRFQPKGKPVSVIPDKKAFSLKMSLRLAEIWSQIDAFDAVFAVGPEATAVMRRYTKAVRKWAANNVTDGVHVAEDEVARAWRRYVKSEPKFRHEPIAVNKRPPG